ncbi:MAG: molybdopterin cofactor-binding domain-containing protein, partial [Candidatus Bipolaricaulota bacterium]
MTPERGQQSYIGQSVPRDDAADKVTGSALYVHDLALPGMLHAAIVLSPRASARIRKIETTRARAVPGVRAVLTGAELDYRLGLYLQDKPILARHVVRYQGEPVAAVAADSLDAAREACALVEVDYEPLPAVLSTDAALAPDAPLVHEALHTYGHMKGVFFPQPDSNIAHHQKIRVGDVERGFATSHLVVCEKFRIPPVQHVPLETHAVIAQALPRDRVEIHTSSQSPYTVRHLLSVTFGIAHANIRVRVPYVGGAFGGKAGIHLEPLAYCLSRAARGRPVKVVATREEELNTLPYRQGLTRTIELGVSREGRIQALRTKYVWDAGAYADYGVNVGRAAAYGGAGPYHVPNCWIDSYVVYTNKVFGTAFRGFGHLEVLWGIERIVDIAARRLGMDPYEFRMWNLLKEGDRTITGEVITRGHGRPDRCLEAVAKGIGWGTRSSPRSAGAAKVRGKGLAVLHKAPAMPTSTSCAAVIKLDEDGSADV